MVQSSKLRIYGSGFRIIYIFGPGFGVLSLVSGVWDVRFSVEVEG